MSISEVRLLDEAVHCLPCLYRVALNNHRDWFSQVEATHATAVSANYRT